MTIKSYALKDIIGKPVKLLRDMPDDVGFKAGMIVEIVRNGVGQGVGVSTNHSLLVRPWKCIQWENNHAMYAGVSSGGIDSDTGYESWWTQSSPDKPMWELYQEIDFDVNIKCSQEELDTMLSGIIPQGVVDQILFNLGEMYES
jgi:hypothetical protein